MGIGHLGIVRTCVILSKSVNLFWPLVFLRSALMRRLPPMNAVRYFERAALRMNFAHAAEDLGVSPGAVSQQVATLEKWLGCHLFQRNNRGLDFTEAGQRYFLAVRTAFEQVRVASALEARPALRGKLDVSSTASFAMKWLLPRFGKFRDLWPNTDITMSTIELVSSFSTSDGDVGLRYGNGDYAGMTSTLIIQDELILVAAPGRFEELEHSQRLNSLPNYPLLLDRHPMVISGYPSWEEYLGDLGVHDVSDLQLREFSQQWMSIEAAICGEGIALVKSCLVENDLQCGKLIRIGSNLLPLKSGYHLVHLPEMREDKIVRSFGKWLKIENEISQLA